MKKILRKILDVLSGLFAWLLAILFILCLLLVLPFDYIKYKRSPYYKTEHKKYKPFAGTGVHFDIYNEIIKNDLPIKYIYNPNNDALECGWFVYDHTLIVPNVFSFEYDAETERWNYCCECEEEDDADKRIIMTLDEYMETEVQEANELAGKRICDKAVALVDASYVENAELAKKENTFLVYDGNREEILRKFCNKV